MANTTDSPIANEAANTFNSVVDALVMQNLAKNVLPELKGFSGITHNGDNTQVAALPVGDKAQETTRSV